MHRYLRAIGFSKIRTKSEQNKLVNAAFHDFSTKQEISVGVDTNLVQINRFFGNNIGISIIGEMDLDEHFTLDHAFPFCSGLHTTVHPEIQIEEHSNQESYSGVSDDYDLGITLIYSLTNIVDYVKCKWTNQFYKVPSKLRFGALSTEGKILCGVHLDHLVHPYDTQPISNAARKKLIAKAKNGDMDALEDLTLDDMDTYSLITKRIKDEDLLTVVETYFMPYGIDNEQYSILGIIKNIDKITNEISKELVYNLTILCNNILLNVVINSVDLEGEPAIGRRFKGIIWLQAKVEFE
ncbi:MAG: DUF3881 family protein [Eubacteriales bacterium]|nr:DUF3881 family protein [Eubacteriales bacterium]